MSGNRARRGQPAHQPSRGQSQSRRVKHEFVAIPARQQGAALCFSSER